MKKYILTIIITINIVCASAIKFNYDLNSYKTPKYSTQSLSFELGTLSQNKNNNDYTFTLSPIIDSTTYEENYEQNNSLENAFNCNSNYYFNQKFLKREHEILIKQNLSLKFDKDNSFSTVNKEYYNAKIDEKRDLYAYDGSLEFFSKNLFYFSQKPFFGELSAETVIEKKYSDNDIELQIHELIDEQEKYSDENINKKSLNFDISPITAFGYGRTFDISKIRSVLYFLEDLEKDNLFIRKITKEEINELASLCYKIEKKRIIDKRKKIKFQIEEIAKFFLNKKLVDSNNPKYIAILYDNWFNRINNETYSSNFYKLESPLRTTGFISKIGLGYDYSVDNENSIKKYFRKSVIDTITSRYSSDSDISEKSPFFFSSFEYHRAIGLNFQFNSKTFGKIGKNKINEDIKRKYSTNFNYEEIDDYNIDSDFKYINTSNIISWFPSNRSSISLINCIYFEKKDKEIVYQNSNNETEIIINEKTKTYNLNTDFCTVYYFTPKIKIRGNIGYDWKKIKFDSESSLNPRNDSYDDYNRYFNYKLIISYILF